MFELEFNGKPYLTADNTLPLFFIAGPCAIESRNHALEVSAALKEIFAAAGISFVYKSSFDKANRSSGAGFRGVGMEEGLSILAEVRESRNVPVLTDIHTAEQAVRQAVYLGCGRQTPRASAGAFGRQNAGLAAVQVRARGGIPCRGRRGRGSYLLSRHGVSCADAWRLMAC